MAIRRTAMLFAVPGGPITRRCSRATALSATNSTRNSRSTKALEAPETASRSRAARSCSSRFIATVYGKLGTVPNSPHRLTVDGYHGEIGDCPLFHRLTVDGYHGEIGDCPLFHPVTVSLWSLRPKS